MDRTLVNSLPEPVMESLYDMRNVQPTKDRIHYFDVVLEGSVESNAQLLQKLYTDILSRANVDFGQIPESKGVLTKYISYPLMEESIAKVNRLFEGVSCDEVKIMNQLHDMIISCRKDYEMGYRNNIEILKIAYCTSVYTLYEMVNICILIYAKRLKDKSGVTMAFGKVKKKDLLILRSAKSLVKCYQSGQWTKMINDMKNDPMFSGLGTSIATEANVFTKFGDFVKRKAASGINVPGSTREAINTGKNIFSKIPTPVKIGVGVVAAIIGLLFAIRGIVYFFYRSSMKIKDHIKMQSEFVKDEVEREKEEGVPDAVIQKHSKLSEKLHSIANFIEVRILKTNAEAKQDIAKSDQENFSTSELKAGMNMFGNDVEL